MSEALDSLEKLIPAPSSRTFQYYRPHYECIRDEILRLREKCRELQAWKDAIDEALAASVQPTSDAYATPQDAVKDLTNWHVEVERYFGGKGW